MNKQQLKHNHRDEMVQIGVRAVEHALRLVPELGDCYQRVRHYLDLIERRDIQQITVLAKKHDEFRQAVANRVKQPRPYTIETCLIHGAEKLLKLSVTERYISGSVLNAVFVDCWNGASCVNGREQQTEMDYQNTVLHPQIETAFEQLRNAEKNLKAA